MLTKLFLMVLGQIAIVAKQRNFSSKENLKKN